MSDTIQLVANSVALIGVIIGYLVHRDAMSRSYWKGWDAGCAMGWQDRHFQQIAKERSRRDRKTGKFKSPQK